MHPHDGLEDPKARLVGLDAHQAAQVHLLFPRAHAHAEAQAREATLQGRLVHDTVPRRVQGAEDALHLLPLALVEGVQQPHLVLLLVAPPCGALPAERRRDVSQLDGAPPFHGQAS